MRPGQQARPWTGAGFQAQQCSFGGCGLVLMHLAHCHRSVLHSAAQGWTALCSGLCGTGSPRPQAGEGQGLSITVMPYLTGTTYEEEVSELSFGSSRSWHGHQFSLIHSGGFYH
jgi:hypothetical protein